MREKETEENHSFCPPSHFGYSFAQPWPSTKGDNTRSQVAMHPRTYLISTLIAETIGEVGCNTHPERPEVLSRLGSLETPKLLQRQAFLAGFLLAQSPLWAPILTP